MESLGGDIFVPDLKGFPSVPIERDCVQHRIRSSKPKVLSKWLRMC
jgi:hypothetical protein